MRFYKKEKVYPKIGEVKYKVFFAWLPFTIGNETRWLERVSVKYIYSIVDNQKWIGSLCQYYKTHEWVIHSFEQQELPDFELKSESPVVTFDYITKKYNPFWVEVNCDFQFQKVKTFLSIIYPEYEFDKYHKWEYKTTTDSLVIGFSKGKPSYDLACFKNDKISFSHFIDLITT